MPVRFLTPQQRRHYGRFAAPPAPEQLARYFSLDEEDLEFARRHRSLADRFSCAVQLGTLRFLGTFLPDPRLVPGNVIAFVAAQLSLPVDLLKRSSRPSVWARQRHRIQEREGYSTFGSEPMQSEFSDWLETRVWHTAERPTLVFDLATTWLVQRRVILPGATTLERLVAGAMRRAEEQLWERLAAAGSKELLESLDSLLQGDDETGPTRLERLRAIPRRVSTAGVGLALERWQELSALGAQVPDLEGLPVARLEELAQLGARVSSSTIRRMTQKRRLATLLAFVRMHCVWALDDCLDVFDRVFSAQMRKAKEARNAELETSLPGFRKAAVTLGRACAVLLDDDCQNEDCRARAFEQVPKDVLQAAVERVHGLGPTHDAELYRHLAARYSKMKSFVARFLRLVPFRSVIPSCPLLRAVEFLKSVLGVRRADWSEVPMETVPRSWRQVVVGADGEVDRAAYTMCVLKRLVDALRRRDVFVVGADRWGDPRGKLIPESEWSETRGQVLGILGRDADWQRERARLEERLTETYRLVGGRLDQNPHVQLIGKSELQISVARLNRNEEPETLVDLKKRLARMLPRVDLPELLLEVHARTGFLHEFRHVGGRASRLPDLPESVSAVLMAEACNIGLDPLVRRDVPALARGRLSSVLQNFLRLQTLVRARARLVQAHDSIPLARRWGTGELATADGVRFLVPVASANSGPNPKYFGFGRGITYYHFTSDHGAGFHDLVVPGTTRDSLFLLAGLLEQRTILNPREVMTDTAGASDIIFGLFWILGFRFSPRLANLKKLRFWRLDRAARTGPFSGLAGGVVRDSLIASQWDEMLRLAGSLKLGRIRVSELTRTLLSTEHPMSPLARAFAELGKILKTIHLLEYIDSEEFRRRIQRYLNLQESRNRLTRTVCHGRRGEIRRKDRIGQEGQLTALGLVVNAIVFWNTLYMDAALERLRLDGHEVRDDDVARLSPLGHRNISFLGQFTFALPELVARGELRAFGNPNEVDPLEDDLS